MDEVKNRSEVFSLTDLTCLDEEKTSRKNIFYTALIFTDQWSACTNTIFHRDMSISQKNMDNFCWSNQLSSYVEEKKILGPRQDYENKESKEKLTMFYFNFYSNIYPNFRYDTQLDTQLKEIEWRWRNDMFFMGYGSFKNSWFEVNEYFL